MSASLRLSFRPILVLLPFFLALTGCFTPVRLNEAPTGEIPEVGSLFFEFNTSLAAQDSLNRWTTEELVHFEPGIPGAFQWVSPSRLKFSPSVPLLPSQDYSAMVQPAVLGGKKQPTDFDTVRFHTAYFEVKSVSFSWYEKEHYGFGAPVEMKVGFSRQVEPYAILDHIEVSCKGKVIDGVRPVNYQETSYASFFIDGEKLPADRNTIRVRFKKDLPSIFEHAKLKEETTLEAGLAPPDQLQIYNAKSQLEDGRITLVIGANQKIDPDVMRSYLTITPPTDLGIESRGSEIRIQGDFKPSSLINISIREGLPGKRGGILKQKFDYNLTLPGLDPFVRFADGQGKYLMRNGAENVNVKCANIPAFEAKLYEVYENNLLHFLNRNSYHFSSWDYYSDEYDYYYGYGDDIRMGDFGNLIAVDSIKIPETRRDQIQNVPINIQKHLRSKYQGIFAMELCESGEHWSKDSKIISLSDLGLIAKKSKNELLVFVNAISTARPVAGASVKLISSTNQVIMTASTDGNGVARLGDLQRRLQMGMGEWKPSLITVTYGPDFNFLDLRRSEIHDGRWEMEAKRRTAHEVFLYSERNLYRPGDTAHFAAIVRDWDMRPERDLPLRFRVYAPDGDMILDKKKVTDAQGSFEVDAPLSLDERTGHYNAEVLDFADNVLQAYRFNVEEFVPDKIKVGLSATQTRGRKGDTLRFPLEAAYYFGSNCSDHKYDYRIVFNEYNFRSRSFREFSFRSEADPTHGLSRVEGLGKLGLDGRDTLEFVVPEDLQPQGPVQGKVYATVYDNTGHTVSRSKTFDLITQDHYVGIRSHGHYFSVNDNFDMEVVAVDQQDAMIAGLPLVIEVQRMDWKQSLRKRGDNFSYVSESKPVVLRRDTIFQGNRPHRFQMRLRDAGNYTVKVSVADSKVGANSVSFSAYGKEVATASSFGVDREGAIGILTDKTQYKTGENARLLFTTPFSGRMLVTVERDEVYEYRYLNVEHNSAELILPLRGESVPNVVVSATLFRPQRTMGALPMTVAHGYTSLKVDNPNLQLPIRIEAPERIKPGQEAGITVRTSPQSDIRVTVAVVDEGILAIKGYPSPDPLSFMYAARHASVSSYDMYKDLLPEVPSAQGATGGGDGGGVGIGVLNPIQARRYRPVAVWSGILRSDASGRVRTRLTVPKEFNGQARIMAVAWHNERFGSGDAPITVKDDVVMMPGVPRFATAGDTLVIPVNLLNTTQKAGNARVELKPGGPLEVLGERSRELKLDPEGSSIAEFRVLARQEIGVATINFKLSGMETAEHDLELAVRPPSPLESESGSGSLVAGKSVEIRFPGGYYPDLHTTKLRISNLPAMQFADDLEYLLRYPHGCVEQTTSAVFPQLYFAELAEVIAPDLYKNSNAILHVKEGIRKLESMQMYDGGFSYWPGGGYGSRWASVYVTHFLLEAQKAGFAVNKSTITRALGHLRNFASEKATFQYVYYRDSRRFQALKAEKEMIYALYVLALAGEPDMPLMNYYKSHPELLTGDTRYQLAAAYALSGDMKGFEALLPQSWEPEETDRLTGASFDSPLRSNAVMLNALVDADPNHPYVEMCIDHLVRNRERILSTQDRAWAFMALGKAVHRNAGNTPEVDVLVDGQLQNGFDGSDLNLGKMDLMGKTVVLRAKPGARGKVWYSWRIDGIRKGNGVKTKDRDNGLRIRRTYYTTDGREYLVPHFKQGELVICKLQLSAERDAKNVAIMDLIPAGFEIENTRLSKDNTDWIKGLSESEFLDARDDRAIFYTSIDAHKQQQFTYLTRVVNRGTFLLPPLGAEAMYDPGLNSYRSGDIVFVHPSEAELPETRLGPLPTQAPPGMQAQNSGQADARDGLWSRIRGQIQL